ncbi:unnamed protein product, partial [marine sediment metagenome]
KRPMHFTSKSKIIVTHITSLLQVIQMEILITKLLVGEMK